MKDKTNKKYKICKKCGASDSQVEVGFKEFDEIKEKFCLVGFNPKTNYMSGYEDGQNKKVEEIRKEIIKERVYENIDNIDDIIKNRWTVGFHNAIDKILNLKSLK